jgi:hypothetical protein
MTSVTGVRTAQCVAELLLNAKVLYRVSRQDVTTPTLQYLS